MEIIITEREILSNSNDYQLGSLVRKKYWDLKGEPQVKDSSKDYISEEGYDKCVVCGRTTQYHHTVPVDQRVGYIDGAGQTCDKSCRK
jgi:hypothetical protein